MSFLPTTGQRRAYMECTKARVRVKVKVKVRVKVRVKTCFVVVFTLTLLIYQGCTVVAHSIVCRWAVTLIFCTVVAHSIVY